MPAVFVSHGSPMLALDESAAHYFLKGMSDLVPLPKDILVVSAHWETDVPRVSLAAQPETIYDFGGFPKALYEMTYPAPGAPDLAGRAAHCLENAGIDVERDPSRGLDHGAWVPLKLIYPEADVPVAQLSIQPDAGPEHHYRLGQALKPLREEGTLILASGAVTHNLEEFFKNGFTRDSGAPDWVRIFAEWTAGALSEGRLEDLLDYRTRAPHAVENHPTEEHLLPLFVAMGAASETLSSERLHKSDAYGVLAMDVYALS
ncbi:MAG: class III extradiol ring-cleavage dioxygenase [Pseudomonadota bacterium]